MTTPKIPKPQISSALRSPVTTQIEVPHQSRTQSIAPHSPHNPKTASNQLCIHGFKLDVIEWKLKEKGPNPMLLLWETSFGHFVDTRQPWKKVLWVSKLLGKVVSLFVMFLNFYSISGFLTLEALQVPISFPFSLSLFLLHFHFKLAIPLV